MLGIVDQVQFQLFFESRKGFGTEADLAVGQRGLLTPLARFGE